MKVLVTGSSGQLGSYVCEALMDDHDVIGLDIREQPYGALRSSSMTGDVRVAADVRKALAGIEGVVHCAAQVSVEKSLEDPLSDAETNVLGTLNLLHESARAGVSKFIYVSSAAVFGNPKYIPIDENHPTQPMSNYGASKLAGEKYALAYARNSKMEVVSVRPFNFYSMRADPESPYSGVITKFVARVKAGRPPVIEGDGRQTRDFIHARDVARMLSLVLKKRGLRGEVFNCGSGTSTSILDLANLAIRISGRPLRPEFTAARVGDIRDSISDNTKSTGMLGFRPKITLEEGLAELMR
ncbi:MAG: NAD-dependent epimerase/dehydratase family protein [Thermoplasmata archaeon]